MSLRRIVQFFARSPGAVFSLVALVWMCAAILFVSRRTVSVEENRRLAEFPQASGFFAPGYDFGGRFERWLSDHFPARRRLVRLSFLLRLRGNLLVRHGPEGWLFSTVLGAPEVYQNANRFTGDELQLACRRMTAFGAAARAAGVQKVYFTFCNDKESICPEHYPSGYAKAHPQSRFDQLWDALLNVTSDVRRIRFTERLLEAKRDTEVFCRSGTHMNDLASFLVYGWLSDRIASDFPGYAKVKPGDCRFGRDRNHTDADLLALGAVPIYPDACLENDFAELKHPKATLALDERRVDGFLRHVRHYRNDAVTNGLRVFFLTDSFGWRWVPFLAESVTDLQVAYIGNDSPFVLDGRSRKEFLEFKPDIVIVNFTERFLQRLLSLEFPKEAN